ncbi:MAG: filamentous hemagglutinin N-terminal domain-containing protein [Stigonema ocellatum SAG 48.90 = DSM 106950]|nr:filamentous hemagglutinin N-terminal domain-containing protein [Stigonema ocellatum SAG 48.90 = DSM 106950]
MGGALALSANCALGQVKPIPDNTLGSENSVVTPSVIKDVPSDQIDGGAIRGRNLFHSFQEFNIDSRRGAYFTNPAGIENIFSRVTGGNASKIFGTLGVLGNANLFLINPNGIIFGRFSSLDVRGSFVGTTANAIQFGNQGFFSATNPEALSPLLTINPSALLFNQIVRSASIQNSSTAPAGVAPTGLNASGLRVPDGKSLLLVGGDITIDNGRLRAYGGLVELGGLAATGTVGLGVNGNNISLSFPTDSTRASVSLINGANVTVSADGGGSITVNASNLNITGGSSLIAGIGQGLGSVGAKAGDITLNATGDIKIDGSGITNNVQQQGIGNGGNITLSTNSLSLTNGAQLQAVTLGQGDAGNVIINATNSVSLDGRRSDIFSTVGSAYDSPENAIKGNGGNIQITTPQLSLTNGAQLQASTFGQGDAGNVIINATNSVSLDGSYTNINGQFLPSGIFSSVGNVYDRPEQRNATKGNGGNIQITTPQISLTNGAELIASTGGQGDAGNVTVNALDAVSLADAAIFSTVESGGVGKGGNININAATLSLKDGARLEASTLGQGNAGTIKVNAAQDVTISGKSSNLNSGLYVDSQSKTGTAGDIIVTSPRVTLDNSGILNAKSESGNGGNINLQSDLLIMRRGALISTTAGMSQAGGNGGNITINATNGFIVAVPNENSDITANAFNGSGGSVKINATNIFGITPRSREDLVKLLGTNEAAELDSQRLPTSDITAISQTSPTLNGTVTVNNLGIDPTQGLVNLPVIPVDTKVAQGCYAGGTQAKSEFIVTGRGGLPPNPGEPLSTDAVDVGLVTLNHGSDNRKSATHSQKPTPIRTPIVQATGWTRNAKGEVVLTADASNVTPQSPRLNPQSCHGVQNN